MKEIKGFPEYYITEDGKVWSDKSNKWMKFNESHQGYWRLELKVNGEGKHKFVHRLVAENYLECPGEGYQVDHIDKDRKNNHVSNLQWLTPKEHAAKDLDIRGTKNPKYDPTLYIFEHPEHGQVISTKLNMFRNYNCSFDLYTMIKGKRKMHKGFTYKGYITFA